MGTGGSHAQDGAGNHWGGPGKGVAGEAKQQKRGAKIKRPLSLTLALGGAGRGAGRAAWVFCFGVVARLVSLFSLITPGALLYPNLHGSLPRHRQWHAK